MLDIAKMLNTLTINLTLCPTDTLQSLARDISLEIDRRGISVTDYSKSCAYCGHKYLSSHIEYGENTFVCGTCYQSNWELKTRIDSWNQWRGDMASEVVEQEEAWDYYTLCKKRYSLRYELQDWCGKGVEEAWRRLDEIIDKISEIENSFPKMKGGDEHSFMSLYWTEEELQMMDIEHESTLPGVSRMIRTFLKILAKHPKGITLYNIRDQYDHIFDTPDDYIYLSKALDCLVKRGRITAYVGNFVGMDTDILYGCNRYYGYNFQRHTC